MTRIINHSNGIVSPPSRPLHRRMVCSLLRGLHRCSSFAEGIFNRLQGIDQGKVGRISLVALSVLIVSALPMHGEAGIAVNGTTVDLSGKNIESDTSEVVVAGVVIRNGGTAEGTGVTISSTGKSGIRAQGDGSVADLTDVSVTTQGTLAVHAMGGTVNLDGVVNIVSDSLGYSANGHGLYVNNGGSSTVDGRSGATASIVSLTQGNAVIVQGSTSSATVSNATLMSSYGSGIQVMGDSNDIAGNVQGKARFTGENLSIVTGIDFDRDTESATYGQAKKDANGDYVAFDHTGIGKEVSNSYGVRASNGAEIILKNSTVTTYGIRSIGLVADGFDSSLTSTGGLSVETFGAKSFGAFLGNYGNSTIDLTDARIVTHGENASLFAFYAGRTNDFYPESTQTLILNGGEFTSDQAHGFVINYVDTTTGSASESRILNADIFVRDGAQINTPNGNLLTAYNQWVESATNEPYIVPTTVNLTVADTSLAGDIVSAQDGLSENAIDGSVINLSIGTESSGFASITGDLRGFSNSSSDSGPTVRSGNGTITLGSQGALNIVRKTANQNYILSHTLAASDTGSKIGISLASKTDKLSFEVPAVGSAYRGNMELGLGHFEMDDTQASVFLNASQLTLAKDNLTTVIGSVNLGADLFTVADGATLEFLFDSNESGVINLGSGDLFIGDAKLSIKTQGGFSFEIGQVYDLITGAASLDSVGGAFAVGSQHVFDGIIFDVLHTGNDTIQLQAMQAVPELSTYALILGAAALGTIIFKRRRQGAAKSGVRV